MEKPFGTDLASAKELNAELHEVFDEEQIFRIDHFLGKEAAQNILAFRFANGLFEPIWNRNHIDHIQIDVPETLGLEQRASFYEAHRRLPGHGGHPPVPGAGLHGDGAADRAGARRHQRGEEQGLPLDAARSSRADVVRGQYIGYRDIEGVAHDSDTETFVALKCEIDNWRWAGVPFYLRTGKRLAEGARIISIAFREPPQVHVPAGSGVGDHGPDHLTFDLADQSRMSLSFYGKRPGPGMKLDKLSMQFAMHETGCAGSVLEAYERLIYDADARRPHPVHHRRGHRAAVGGVAPAAGEPAAGAALRAGLAGAPTRSTSWSRRSRGGCRSSDSGATQRHGRQLRLSWR